MARKKVLITGGAGLIGTVTRQRLSERFELSILDLKEVEGVESHVADLADLDAIRPAFEGKDVVVHLGGDPRGQAPWDSVLRNNIAGTYNVMEASRLAGVGRVVFAAADPKFGACGSLANLPRDERLNHRCQVVGGVLAEESALLLREFFQRLR